MINLYALLGIKRNADTAVTERACRELQDNDAALAAEASDVLLHDDRARLYRQMHTQYSAIAMAHRRLVDEEYGDERVDGKSGGRWVRGKKISKQFKDTNHWSRRLVEFP